MIACTFYTPDVSKTQKKKLKTIGYIETIDFIDGDVHDIECKVDTGADNCAVHCARVVIKIIDGEEYLCFKLLDKKNKHYSGVEIRSKEFKEKKVKSAIGDFEYRYQVKLKVKFYDKIYTVPFNLSNRSHMKYPVLIGRRFLNNKFLVDVHQKHLSNSQ